MCAYISFLLGDFSLELNSKQFLAACWCSTFCGMWIWHIVEHILLF